MPRTVADQFAEKPVAPGVNRAYGAAGDSLNSRTDAIHSAAPQDPTKITITPMKDLKADWRKWTRIEKWVAASFAIAASTIVPALFLLGRG